MAAASPPWPPWPGSPGTWPLQPGIGEWSGGHGGPAGGSLSGHHTGPGQSSPASCTSAVSEGPAASGRPRSRWPNWRSAAIKEHPKDSKVYVERIQETSRNAIHYERLPNWTNAVREEGWMQQPNRARHKTRQIGEWDRTRPMCRLLLARFRTTDAIVNSAAEEDSCRRSHAKSLSPFRCASRFKYPPSNLTVLNLCIAICFVLVKYQC